MTIILRIVYLFVRQFGVRQQWHSSVGMVVYLLARVHGEPHLSARQLRQSILGTWGSVLPTVPICAVLLGEARTTRQVYRRKVAMPRGPWPRGPWLHAPGPPLAEGTHSHGWPPSSSAHSARCKLSVGEIVRRPAPWMPNCGIGGLDDPARVGKYSRPVVHGACPGRGTLQKQAAGDTDQLSVKPEQKVVPSCTVLGPLYRHRMQRNASLCNALQKPRFDVRY
jgi:hypothetical protein